MKKGLILISLLIAASTIWGNSIKEKNVYYGPGHYLEGELILPGYDCFGYNYQAHIFCGSYFNAYAGGAGLPPYEGDSEAYLAENPTAANHWAWPYRDIEINMKWNEAWLSNKDLTGAPDGGPDGKLDRPDSYIGSGAWEMYHETGPTGDPESAQNGKKSHYTYFCKIVAAPADAVLEDGMWYTADGTEIGPVIWGSFAIVQEISNDPSTGDHGAIYVSPAAPGLGKY